MTGNERYLQDMGEIDVQNELYRYAVYEASPRIYNERRKAYNAAAFTERETELYTAYWLIAASTDFEQAKNNPAICARLAALNDDPAFSPERYWIFVNGKQSECFHALLRRNNAGLLQEEDIRTFLALFREAFVVKETFPLCLEPVVFDS